MQTLTVDVRQLVDVLSVSSVDKGLPPDFQPLTEEGLGSNTFGGSTIEGQVTSFEQVAASAHQLADMSGQMQLFIEQLQVLPRLQDEQIRGSVVEKPVSESKVVHDR